MLLQWSQNVFVVQIEDSQIFKKFIWKKLSLTQHLYSLPIYKKKERKKKKILLSTMH